jgi:glycosyltransferase involved in cell wall biosynthesis
MTYGVITICLNAEPTIRQTIDSVVRQTTAPEQIVFVDGGSTDGTVELLEQNRSRIEDRGSRMDLLRQEPISPGAAGIPRAWNQGLRAMHTDVVFILNADDWYEPDDAAETVLNAFRDNPEAGLVVSPVLMRAAPAGPARRVLRQRSFSLLPVLMPVPHPGCFVKRKVYDIIGDYDERYAISADYDFVFRCHRAGVPVVTLDRPLVGMRTGGLAGRRRHIARRETLEIGLRHCRCRALPRIAYVLRCCLNR